MVETGQAVLYLTRATQGIDPKPGVVSEAGVYQIQDWGGRLRFACFRTHHNRHNIAGVRRDTWFNGPDGWIWHAVQYGEWSEIARCRRTKRPVKTGDPLTDVAYEKARAA